MQAGPVGVLTHNGVFTCAYNTLKSCFQFNFPPYISNPEPKIKKKITQSYGRVWILFLKIVLYCHNKENKNDRENTFDS